ncbi:D-alanyl-D-alanine carboxypeptidase (penicillin-binding protein 5/6) [Natronocella acetinitrilica]|uniref:serine-type D-Ala-D-Ala carboxypeptidase n=1 Tax=Natronocella acetinitrilica TaxID=414046 RepID=A0AAE3FZX7_9GAMM|nr:D-alanyl-D-alanine carboxypeptidase family protein [Natronocella acetinitrilica]MCP1672970.1 D-alanyl-D-alanine carboxypeptidase (penicillin-binding protein 5/6) [Natronocella acetinitrilica]
MKRLCRSLCLLTLSLTFTSAVVAQSMPVPVPAPPSIAAPSHILLDSGSGQVLVERNPDERREPASLVKVMTAYVVFSEIDSGHLSLSDPVIISERAWRMGGSRMFVEVNRSVSVEDLLRGVIIQSGNDASVALAEHVAGDERTFAQLMNQYADQIGMQNTNFTNSTGWPDENQYTSARDMALLAQAMIRNFPEYYRMYSEREFTFNDITQRNRNQLLWRDDSVDGLKTGHTSTAGYNLVTSAQRDGMRLVSVVMGTESPRARADQSQSLLNYGFRFFQTYELYAGGRELSRPKLWKGAEDTVPVGVAESLMVTIPQRQYDNLDASMQLNTPLIAPVSQGQQVGDVEVRLEGEVIARAPLIALEDIAEGGFFGRMIDELWLMFQ